MCSSLKVVGPRKQLSSASVLTPLSTQQPHYEIKDGIRYVKPYFQTIRTTVKRRWLNRHVLDVLSSEFRSFSASEYRRRIENDEIGVIHQIKRSKEEKKQQREKGFQTPTAQNRNISLSNSKMKIMYPDILSHKLSDNDVIERLEHIHERSVCATKPDEIEVIFEDNDTLVVNKPSGIPIHPVQNYFYNSLVQVLQNEGWSGRKVITTKCDYQLRPCHRLDKLTSGVCIFAKSKDSARKIQMEIQNRDVEKVYLACVKGKFPGIDECDSFGYGKEIVCCDDIIVLDTKKGAEDGIMRKDARTVFKCVKYNKDLNKSIVMCWPKTGRTHQIRIHLRNLGHPIVNDPLYGPDGLMSLGENDGSKDVSDEYFKKVKAQAETKRLETESGQCCETCGIKLYVQTERDELVMYLHAYEYKIKDDKGWSYRTNWPEWSKI